MILKLSGEYLNHCVSITVDEWQALIAPAGNGPIDGATVNSYLLDKLFDLPAVDGEPDQTLEFV